MQQKVCPVITRTYQSKMQLLLFNHPISELSVQLVKGTIEPGELPEVAALRELEEESGISKAAIDFEIGELSFPTFDQHWHLYKINYQHDLPERWEYFADEEGGLLFSFFWQDLDKSIDNPGYSLFEAARQFIKHHLYKKELV